MGDSTDAIMEWVDAYRPPPRQLRFDTETGAPDDFPLPAYHLISLPEYFISSIQFSSGCPYSCEFCDIPALYGRNARLKSAPQVLAELDALVAGGAVAIYFVDDNFIANQRAALELLPHLVEWQRRNRFPVRFACEATLNIAKNERVLALMRDAGFNVVFCGIETPEPDALRSMSKDQNLRMPILDAVAKLNDYGLEVVSGIILGLDTANEATDGHLIDSSRLTDPMSHTISTPCPGPRSGTASPGRAASCRTEAASRTWSSGCPRRPCWRCGDAASPPPMRPRRSIAASLTI